MKEQEQTEMGFSEGYKAGVADTKAKLVVAAEDGGKVNTGNGFEDGKRDGSAAAVNDYLAEIVDLSIFDTKSEDDDAYTFGFECGYMRKLAEILVG